MYTAAHDDVSGLAVWSCSQMVESDWDRGYRDMNRIAGWSKKLGKRGAIVMFVSGLFTPPNAVQRAKLAAAAGQAGYDPYLAVVSTNPVIRGVFTAISWVAPATKYESKIFADSFEARAWLEQKRGEALPGLEPLLVEVVGRRSARAS